LVNNTANNNKNKGQPHLSPWVQIKSYHYGHSRKFHSFLWVGRGVGALLGPNYNNVLDEYIYIYKRKRRLNYGGESGVYERI